MEMPALSRSHSPCPGMSGFGSSMPITTRSTCLVMSLCAQGILLRDVHGSKVVYTVALAAWAPVSFARAASSACGTCVPGAPSSPREPVWRTCPSRAITAPTIGCGPPASGTLTSASLTARSISSRSVRFLPGSNICPIVPRRSPLRKFGVMSPQPAGEAQAQGVPPRTGPRTGASLATYPDLVIPLGDQFRHAVQRPLMR